MTPEELNRRMQEVEDTFVGSERLDVMKAQLYDRMEERIRELEAELAVERARPRPKVRIEVWKVNPSIEEWVYEVFLTKTDRTAHCLGGAKSEGDATKAARTWAIDNGFEVIE